MEVLTLFSPPLVVAAGGSLSRLAILRMSMARARLDGLADLTRPERWEATPPLAPATGDAVQEPTRIAGIPMAGQCH